MDFIGLLCKPEGKIMVRQDQGSIILKAVTGLSLSLQVSKILGLGSMIILSGAWVA